MELKLTSKKLFEGFEIECYEDYSRENGDFYMTAKQIGEALEYQDNKSYYRIINRNKEIIGEPTVVNLSTIEGNREVSRDIELYSFNQLFQILRFSKQPKANLFMSWASITLQELITQRAELKFSKQEDSQAYTQKIKHLTKELNALIKNTDTMEMRDYCLIIGIGRTTLFKILRKLKFIDDNNVPYQKYSKLFDRYFSKDGYQATGITKKGIKSVTNKLVKEGYIS